MKKFTILLLFFLCLSFNIIQSKHTFAVSNTFKEGIYTFADLNTLPNNSFIIKNVSNTDSVHVFIFNEDLSITQSLKLEPNSQEYNTVPMKPNYILVVTGKGEVTVVPKSPWIFRKKKSVVLISDLLYLWKFLVNKPSKTILLT